MTSGAMTNNSAQQATKFLVKIQGEAPQALAAQAETTTNQLVDMTWFVVRLAASNRIVVYGDHIASQVVATYAGNVVPHLRRALFETEMLHLTRLWDPPATNRVGIQTSYYLSLDPEVRKAIDERWVMTPDRDERDRAWMMARRARSWRRLDRIVPAVANSKLLAGMRNYRDKYLAHRLTQSAAELRGEVFRPPVLGDERKLLRATVTAIRVLNLTTREGGFDYSELQDLSRRDAEAFWYGCQIRPLE